MSSATSGNGDKFVPPPRPEGLRKDLAVLYTILTGTVVFFVFVGESMKHPIPEGKYEKRDRTLVDIGDYDVVQYGPYPKCHERHDQYQHVYANGTVEWKKISDAPQTGPFGLGHPENPEWQVQANLLMQRENAENGLKWKGLQPCLHLLVLAMLSVYIGAKHAVWLFTEPIETREETQVLKTEDAYWFPITASCMLFGLFLLYKYIGTDWIKFAVSCAVVCMCTLGIGQNANHFGALLQNKVLSPLFTIPYVGETVTSVELLGYIVGVAMAVGYIMTKNWIVNNVFGLCFCLIAIKLVGLQSYKTGVIMLWGLFFYDVFWVFGSKSVFGSNVMVTVATGVEAPIKLQFPRYIGGCGDLKFSMLGLGDIAVPGIFIAFIAKWDAVKIGENVSNSFVYLNATMIAYALSLITTVFVMLVFNAAQPALLYIVPYIIFTTIGVALYRGEFKQLWDYYIPDEDESKQKTEEDKNK